PARRVESIVGGTKAPGVLMSIPVIVPQIGQSIAEATIIKWLKKQGERVEKGESLVEIGTDKINTEIPAPETGIVQEILAQEGETVPIETKIAILSESSPKAENQSAASSPKSVRV